MKQTSLSKRKPQLEIKYILMEELRTKRFNNLK